MKRLLIAGGILTIMAWSLPVSAATNFSFSPSNIAVTKGQTFTVNLTVNPNQIDNYTVKIELVYSADLLEVKSFNFSNGWTALSQPGYDLIDNQAGHLVKTAGYLGGFSNSLNFGTVSFISKKSGTSSIKITNGSLALDKDSQDLFDGLLSQSLVIIKEPTPAIIPAPIKKPVSQAPSSSAEKVSVLGATIPEGEIDQKEQIISSEQEIITKSSAKKLGQESLKILSNCQKISDWTVLLLGFIDGVLLTIIIFNILKKRRQKRAHFKP